MLTGKCKEAFEKWYESYIMDLRPDYLRFSYPSVLKKFYRSIKSMQYGVYVDFFESLDLKVTIVSNILGFSIEINDIFLIVGDDNHFTRREARKEAILKANEILNKQLNND